MLAALRQRRDHRADRHPRHLRHAGLPRAGRPPSRGGLHDDKDANHGRSAGHDAGDGRHGVRQEQEHVVQLQDAAKASGDAIKLGFSAWPGWFPWQVAEEKGLFTKGGVNVDLSWFESYLDTLNALAAGKLDANSQTLNDTMSSVAAAPSRSSCSSTTTRRATTRSSRGPASRRVADLKGKKVAAEQGTVDHYLLLLGPAEGRADARRTSTSSPSRRAPRPRRSSPGASTRSACSRRSPPRRSSRAGAHGALHVEGVPGRHPRPPGRSSEPRHRTARRRPEARRRLVRDARLDQGTGRGHRDHGQARRRVGGRLQDLRRRHDDLHPAAEPRGVRPGHDTATWTSRPTRSPTSSSNTGSSTTSRRSTAVRPQVRQGGAAMSA